MMNKKLIAAAIVALSGAFAINAQQVCANPQTCKEQKCAPGNDCKQQCTPDKNCYQQYCDKGRKMANPFEGLNLTADQQSKLKALGEKSRAERKEAKATEKAKTRELRNDRRKKMLADIKAILTPEQYIQFLENNFVRDGRDGRQFRDGKDKPMQRKQDKKMRRPDGKTKADNKTK